MVVAVLEEVETLLSENIERDVLISDESQRLFDVIIHKSQVGILF